MGGISGIFVSVLNAIYSFVGNYGWSVVLFTLLVRMVLMPLDIKQKKQMRAMSRLQPMQAELQRKYGKDKEKYNVKLQELYKREKVSPFSGCLPMLIQLPLLWLMFSAMRSLASEQIAQMLLGIVDSMPAFADGTTVRDMLSVAGADLSAIALTAEQAQTLAANIPFQSWLWIKNVFEPDTFMSAILPTARAITMENADVLKSLQLSVVSGSNVLTAGNLDIVASFLKTPAYASIAGALGANDFIRIPLNLLFFNPTLTLPKSFGALLNSANGLFILPLFAAASQFFMTKLTAGKQPATPAPADGQPNPMNMNSGFMKWFFPLFSLWICAGYNAAFAIYWAAVNVIQIITTYFINLYFERRDRQAALAGGQSGSDQSGA